MKFEQKDAQERRNNRGKRPGVVFLTELTKWTELFPQLTKLDADSYSPNFLFFNLVNSVLKNAAHFSGCATQPIQPIQPIQRTQRNLTRAAARAVRLRG